jgi:hypothetical protein
LYVAAAPSDLRERAAASVKVLPRDSGFGHLTSAALRGWWLPNRLDGVPVLFGSTTSKVHVQRPGVYVRRSRFTVVEDVDGLPLVTPAETLLELSQDLSLVDLVPMVDCALASGTCELDLLSAARPGARGAVVLRRAVALADPRSESWWESVLRLMHVVTDLGPVECQVDIWADDLFVARADLHLTGTRRYPECDGGEHRTKERHERDLVRDKALQRMQVERYGYTTREIECQPDLVIRDAETARGVRHSTARVHRWRRLATRSTLSGHGRARLLARLARYRRAAAR